MTNSEFIPLARIIGDLLQGSKLLQQQSSFPDLIWKTTKQHIKRHLDEAHMTPAEFDAQLRKFAPRRRLTKLAKMDWSNI